MRFLGIDLAWREDGKSGVATLEEDGTISEAGLQADLRATVAWISNQAGQAADQLLFVDAPLVVPNATGQRECERQVGERYWRSKVSANSNSRESKRDAGQQLLKRTLRARAGWRYDDGTAGPPDAGLTISECYPYTTIVGAPELGYEVRPPYKFRSLKLPANQAWPRRMSACDDLIHRLGALKACDPPLDLRSHGETRALLDSPSPRNARAYKDREDLLDAVISAWTAALWWRRGLEGCQVLGEDTRLDRSGRRATIIAPSKDHQRAWQQA